MLPRKELLQDSCHPEDLGRVLTQAETALRTWEPLWTDFLDGAVREEIQERLGGLAELELHGHGGYSGAERQRLLLLRRDAGIAAESLPVPLAALELSGNFLFDPAEPDDLRAALTGLGIPAGGIGDLWMRGDRGGEGVVSLDLTDRLNGTGTLVRSVEVQLCTGPLTALQPPARRQPRHVHTVEASTRLDAVASAGFGLPRSRMASLIRAGQVRVNWESVNSPSRELLAGDRVLLKGKGELLVESIAATKRERFRIGLLRQ